MKNKYYFINKFDTNNIDKQSKETIIIYRNYTPEKVDEKQILKIKNYYQKIDEKISTPYLFKRFFNNDNEKKPINKIYNSKTSIYELN